MDASNLTYRILYADDNEDSRDMMTMMCRISGIEIVTASTIGEAWKTAQAEDFDLYLLDARFPDGDGLTLCRDLRRFAPHIPILIYSGNAFAADRQMGLDAGASDYLTKPYPADIAATIRRNIDTSREHARQARRVSSNHRQSVRNWLS